MINCYIISDLTTIECLEKHIDKFPITTLCGYTFAESFNVEEILINNPRIIFIDIELLKRFKPILIDIAKICSVIYLANTKINAYEAFEATALDYLLKPLSFETFEKSINKFISFSLLAPTKSSSIAQTNLKIEAITDSFFIKSDFRGQKEILIKCNDVIFIEAEQNYVVLRTIDKSFICHNTLKEMEESLPNRYFIRVHKSFIINYDKISSVEGTVITLNENDKYKIQIGSTYKKAFFERKSQKIIRKKAHFDLITKYACLLLFIKDLFNYGYGII